jgi:hypothetical protein
MLQEFFGLNIGLRGILQLKLYISLLQRCGYRQYNALTEPLDNQILR